MTILEADDADADEPVRVTAYTRQDKRAVALPFARHLQTAALLSVLLAIAAFAGVGGLYLRHWAWIQTEPVRFIADIDNAFTQGTITLQGGYLNRYDQERDDPRRNGMFDLDYAPGRLLIATEWARWVRGRVDGQHDAWQLPVPWNADFYRRARTLGESYALCRPLLTLNSIAESVAVVGLFALVWLWTGRPDTAPRPNRPPRPVMRSAVAVLSALLLWFNPELIWNAHCWPQWDCWLLPFFIWALVAASAEAWFTAGVLIAVGMMFKAQILFGAPLFLLWPIFRGRFGAAGRWCAGALAGAAACTAVWCVRVDGGTAPAAVAWVGISMIALAVLLVLVRRSMLPVWWISIPLFAAATGLLLWPVVSLTDQTPLLIGLLVVAAACAGFRYLPARSLPAAAAAWAAVSLFLCVPLFGGSAAWWQIGVARGTTHYPRMGSGPNNNLAELMESGGWHLADPLFTLPAHGRWTDTVGNALAAVDRTVTFHPGEPAVVPVKYGLFVVFAVGVVLSAFGMAMQSRSRSPRFLAAAAAPWVLMFAVLGQMHQRYLLWGACMTAGAAALGPGFVLLHLLLAFVGVGQEVTTMTRSGYTDWWAVRFFTAWHPGVGYAVILAAGIYLYTAVAPVARKR